MTAAPAGAPPPGAPASGLRGLASPRARALAALVLALAALRALAALPSRVEEPAAPAPLIVFRPDAVARLELARGERRFALERAGGGWVVTRAGDPPLPARPGADALLARIAAWTDERLAGADPARHDALGVSEARARRLRLEGPGGEGAVDLFIGNLAGAEAQGSADPERLGTLVRIGGQDLVHVVPDLLAGEVEPDPRGWYAPPGPGVAGAARRIALRRGDAALATVVLAPGQPARLEAGAPADGEAVLTLLAWLDALAVEAPAPAEAAPPDALSIEVEGDAGPWSGRLWSRPRPGPGADATWLLARPGAPTVEVGAAAGGHLDLVARRGLAAGGDR